jgi:hypothetical protein
MGRTCSTHGRDKKFIQYFSWKTEDLYVNWKIILQRILGKRCRRVWTGFSWLRIGKCGGRR